MTDWLAHLFQSSTQTPTIGEMHWRNLEFPLVFIWGRKDTVIPISKGEELARFVYGAHLLVMDGVGHVPQIEAPEAFYTNIIKAMELIKKAGNRESER